MPFVLGSIFFAVCAYAGALLGDLFHYRERLPGAPQRSEPPVARLIAAGALCGGVLALHAASVEQIAICGAFCAILIAIWCTDARYGIIPDALTLTPLTALAVFAFMRHEWSRPLSSALVCTPFALLALVSRGRGMGWGDVKLAAMSGAVLGAPSAILAFAVGSAAAVVHAYLRSRIAAPIAFAPYLIAGIALVLPFEVAR